ncbi:MAG TPA: plasmid partition protein ParG [Coleofasciculaceae cyanobacterium]
MGEINQEMAKLPPNMTELSTYIDKDLKLKFKLACTARERSMSEIVTELIEGWLEENDKSPTSGTTGGKRRGNKGDEE